VSGLDKSHFTDAQRDALAAAAHRSAKYLRQLRREQCDVFCHGNDTTAGRYDAWIARESADWHALDELVTIAYRWPS